MCCLKTKKWVGPTPLIAGRSQQPVPQFPADKPAPVLEHTPPRELAESEVQDLVAAGDETTRALIMALLSGLSVEEVTALHWQDVDLESAEAHIGGNSPRNVSIPAPLREALTGLGSNFIADAQSVWVDTEGNPLTGDDLTALITTAAYDTGLTQPVQVTGEAIRHTYIAYLVRQGVGLKDLKHLTAPIPPTELVTYGRLSPPGPGVPLDQIDRVYPLFRESA
jgi:succinoglycan biosynthesis transport protein ExoP